VDLQGASGNLDFDPATEETSGPIEVWHIPMMGGTWMLTADHTVSP
jgi:hypothetical protein